MSNTVAILYIPSFMVCFPSASSTFTNTIIDAGEVTIDFDDSIIEDRGAEQVRAMQEVSQGLRSKLSYMTKYQGLNEEQAQEELDTIQQEKMSNQEAFGFTTNSNGEEE